MKELDNKKRNKYITSMGKNIQFIKLEKEIKELIVGDERAEWLNFSKNEIIYGYDSYKKSLGIILKGKVSVRKDRTSNVLINTLGNGDIFGGAALFSKYDRFIGTLRAETDSDILFIPENLMEEIIVKSPESAVSYIKYLSESLMFLNNRLDIFTAGGAEERTLEYIRKNSRTDENGRTVADGMSMTELSEYLAVGRATLYRILDEFQRNGIIQRDGRKIYIEKEI
ncbi:MAG: Crp/Fnr family transcriptional regulator [Clostridiales bacterium]|nr:Crp/Fnr family transcriptional regulator [Clostridiales bacterium]